jgi:hypothetical protein
VLPGADSAELSAFLRSEREGWTHRDLLVHAVREDKP